MTNSLLAHTSREDCFEEGAITTHWDEVTGTDVMYVPESCDVCGRRWEHCYQHIDVQGVDDE